MKILLYMGIGVVLLEFLVSHYQRGWNIWQSQTTVGPSGETIVIPMWSPADVGCYLIIIYLVWVSVRWTVRFVRRRASRQ
jgi:hypothetical protein